MKLCAGRQWRCRLRAQTCGHSRGRRVWDKWSAQHGNTYITACETARGSLLHDTESWDLVLGDDWRDGMGWEGASRRRGHMDTYGRLTVTCGRDQLDIVKQLSNYTINNCKAIIYFKINLEIKMTAITHLHPSLMLQLPWVQQIFKLRLGDQTISQKIFNGQDCSLTTYV